MMKGQQVKGDVGCGWDLFRSFAVSAAAGETQKSGNNDKHRKENVFIENKRTVACVSIVIASSSSPQQRREPLGHGYQRPDNRPPSGALI